MLHGHPVQICLVCNKRLFIRVQTVHPGVKKGIHDYQIKREQKNGSIFRPSFFLENSITGGVLQVNAFRNRKIKEYWCPIYFAYLWMHYHFIKCEKWNVDQELQNILAINWYAPTYIVSPTVPSRKDEGGKTLTSPTGKMNQLVEQP